MESKKNKSKAIHHINTIQNKKIHKHPKPHTNHWVPKKVASVPARSNSHLFDYLEEKRKTNNILPLSGPDIPQNFVQCQYYAKGKCKFGTNCRFSHNFVEKMPIEVPNESSNNSVSTFSFTKKGRLALDPHLVITTVKTFTVTYKNSRTKTFLAALHSNRKILIYSLNHPSALCSFEFSALEQVVNFDFFSQSSDVYKNKSVQQLSYECNIHMLTIHINDKMRLFNIPKAKCVKTYKVKDPNMAASSNNIYRVDNINLLKDLMTPNMTKDMPHSTKVKLGGLKSIRVWMIVQQLGRVVFIDARKGVTLSSMHIGVQVRDIVFTLSNEAPDRSNKSLKSQSLDAGYTRNRHMQKMPSSAAVAGDKIHIWDFTKHKASRTLAYNSYSHYLAIAGVQVKEFTGGLRSLIVALGKLQDSIISFGHELFIEIWNPQTGGCVKRITETALFFNKHLNDVLKFSFLTVVPMKSEDDESDGAEKIVCLASAGNKVEAWDLLNDRMLAKHIVEDEHEISAECFTVFGDGKCLVIDRDLESNCFDLYKAR